MKEIIFVLCVVAVTAYLAVTAWEDHQTCTVTRWRHLIGAFPAVILFLMNMGKRDLAENIMILSLAGMYVLVGFIGVYGFADGLVLANLSLFCGSIGGVTGSGAVLLIMTIAAFSFGLCHVVRNVMAHGKIFQDVAGALIPHILVGYTVVLVITVFKVL